MKKQSNLLMKMVNIYILNKFMCTLLILSRLVVYGSQCKNVSSGYC